MDSVVNFEIPADDTERAREFYTRAFGWGMNRVPEFEYTNITTTPSDDRGMPQSSGAINGRLQRRGMGLEHPVVTVRVDSIEVTLQKVERLGGRTVAPKMPFGDMGDTAYVMDTEGNVIGLWQAVEM
jgi:uncharacterized protein